MTIRFQELSGSGERVVVASATGVISAGGPSAGYVTGSGTVNTIPLWTPSGTNLGNSIISQSGSAITVAGTLAASNLSGTNTGDQTITLTGNVTGSGTGSFATTIAPLAVTNSMINDVGWLKITGTPTTLSGYGITDAVGTTRTISTTSPLAGGGDLSANRTLSISTNGISDSLFRQSAALSVVGNGTNATANVSDLTASTDAHVLRRSGTTLGFGTIGDASISALAWSKITSTPTTLSGYGITDAMPKGSLTLNTLPRADASGFLVDSGLSDNGTTITASRLITASGGILINGGTSATGTITKNSTTGMLLWGQTGNTYDFAVVSTGGGELLANPTGTVNLTVGASGGTTTMPGPVSMSSTLGVTGVQTNSAAVHLAGGSFVAGNPAYGQLFSDGTYGAWIVGRSGSFSELVLTNAAGTAALDIVPGTQNVRLYADADIAGDVSMSSTLGVTGAVSLSNELRLASGGRTTAGAGGTEISPTQVAVGGKSRVILTPTAGDQYYELTGMTDGQIVWVVNASNYNLFVEGMMESETMTLDGAGLGQTSAILIYDSTIGAWVTSAPIAS